LLLGGANRLASHLEYCGYQSLQLAGLPLLFGIIGRELLDPLNLAADPRLGRAIRLQKWLLPGDEETADPALHHRDQAQSGLQLVYDLVRMRYPSAGLAELLRVVERHRDRQPEEERDQDKPHQKLSFQRPANRNSSFRRSFTATIHLGVGFDDFAANITELSFVLSRYSRSATKADATALSAHRVAYNDAYILLSKYTTCFTIC